MKCTLVVLAMLAATAGAQDITFQGSISGLSAGLSPGTTTVGSTTNCFLYSDASSLLRCGATFTADDSGSGNGAFTLRKTTLAAGSDTAGFFAASGTLTQTTSGIVINGYDFQATPVGSASAIQRAMRVNLAAGYTGTANMVAVRGISSSANTGTTVWGQDSQTNGPSMGAYFTATGTSTGTKVGFGGAASGGDKNFGFIAASILGKSNATNIGGLILYGQSSGTPVRAGLYVYQLPGAVGEPANYVNAAIVADNGAVADPLIVARDATAALPTTGATATWQIRDGAWPQVGNGVLTSATMTAENQARDTGSLLHSYTWTNAQVAALSGTAGDITVATLPAKTQVKNAYVVITGAAAGPTTVTVSCGDANDGTPFIGYILPSDAKAAANTVYGDAVGERGASIDTETYYLPSYTATTLVTCHFISTGANLSTVTGSTGRVILETALLP